LAAVGARLTALALVSGIPLEAAVSILPVAIPTVAVCERVGNRVNVSAGRLVVENGVLRTETL
jgi:hypothetical protein